MEIMGMPTYKSFFGKHNDKNNASSLSLLFYNFKPWYQKESWRRRSHFYYRNQNLCKYKRFWLKKSTKFKGYPWITASISRRSLYKYIFFRPSLRNKLPKKERKNSIYHFYWKKYVFFRTKRPKKWQWGTNGKKWIRVQPWIRYYIYLPYFGHISPKRFIKKNKKARNKTKNNYNKRLNEIELNIMNFLTKNNISVHKRNAQFLLKHKAVYFHNTGDVFLVNKKTEIYKSVSKKFTKQFNWKNKIFQLNYKQQRGNKYELKEKTAVSVNNDYIKNNWTLFLSKQNKKHCTKNINVSFHKNIVYINRYLSYKDILKNDKMSFRRWAAISLLKNKIRYNIS